MIKAKLTVEETCDLIVPTLPVICQALPATKHQHMKPTGNQKNSPPEYNMNC